MKKSQRLRNSDKFKKVFISPDGTTIQRDEHRKLVVQMKERAAEDKSKRFFIRDGNVESVERDRGAGGSRDSSSEEGSDESSVEVESEESEYSVDIRD